MTLLDALLERATAATLQVQVEVGIVGWASADSHYDKGNSDAPPGERHTLIRVTLARGQPPGDGRAAAPAGQEIYARMSGGIFRIPKKGTIVYVIVPHGMEETPGAAMIIGTCEDDPPIQFEEDRVVLGFGDDVHVVVRGKSVSLSDAENRFLTVGIPRSGGPGGLIFQAKDGSGGVIQEGVVSWFVASSGDAKTIIQMTPSKYEVLFKASLTTCSIMKLEGNDFSISSPGNGYLMPATLVLGPIGSGSPPHVPVNTPAKISGCVFVSNDSP